MTTDIYTPYTYLIGWTHLDTWYYGVRFANECHPDDLWISYYTSSKYVKRFRKEHGEPDIIQIRHTFKSKQSALEWEYNVISRMELDRDSRFLNKRNPKSQWYGVEHHSEESKIKMRKPKTPRIMPEEERLRRSESARRANAREDVREKHKKVNSDPDHKEKHRQAVKDAMARPEVKLKIEEYNSKSETFEKRSKAQKEIHSRPDVIEKYKETYADPEWKQKRGDISKEVLNRPEVQEKRLASLKETNSLPEVKEKRSKSATEHNNQPGMRERKSKTMKETKSKK